MAAQGGHSAWSAERREVGIAAVGAGRRALRGAALHPGGETAEIARVVVEYLRTLSADAGAAVVRALLVVDGHHLHAGDAGLNHIDLLGGGVGEIDDAAASKGAAVGHLHHDLAAVGHVAHADHRAEGQRAVGAGQAVAVVGRTVAGAAAVKLVAVVCGVADALAVALGFGVGGRKDEGDEAQEEFA